MDISPWDDAEDENEEEESGFLPQGRNAMVFLIDASPKSFEKDENDNIPFQTFMECCKTTMLNKIISSEGDLIGIVLFGTEKTDNVLNVNRVVTLQDLLQPSAEKIKQAEAILEDDNFKDFKKNYGQSNDCALSDALWLCQTLFSNSPMKLGSQRILLLTCHDDPHAHSPHKQQQARSRADGLCQGGVQLELLHLGKNFDPKLFYQELLQLAQGKDYGDYVLPDPATKLEELLTRICRRDHKRRTIARVLFKLGADVTLGVAMYNLVRRMNMPTKVSLDRATNETLHRVQHVYDGNTGELMLPLDIAKYQEFGGKQIKFQVEEVRDIRHMVDPGLYLMGFKPASRIKLHNYYKPGSFLYPDDTLVKGSRQLFVALLERCAAREVVPVCWLAARRNSPPQLVALLPQMEELDESNNQVLPPGFHVIYLPYADSIRALEMPETEQASPEEKELAKKVIKKLRFNYKPDCFDNPRLQTHWSNMEAVAMDYKERREVIDYSLPDNDALGKKLGSLSLEFVDTFYPAGFEPEAKGKPPKPATKRPTEAGTGRASKAVKLDELDMEDVARQGKVEKLTVDVLKTYLTGFGIKVTGKKKADLVNMVYDHLDIPQPK